MSRPRPVLPGTCYLVTRRCLERRFFLRPDKVVTETFWYVLGYVAQKYNIGIVAACAMSNHYHLEIVDGHGCFPDFLRDFNALLARSINAHRGRWENFWSGTQTSMVQLLDGESQVEKAAYVICNPVKDDLVEFAHSWPGATSFEAIRQRRSITAKRPAHFFRRKNDQGRMPESVTIEFIPPPAFKDDPEEFIRILSSRVTEEEGRARKARNKTGRRVLGRKSILSQRWNDRPSTLSLRRKLSPRVAARNKWSRIEALERNRVFEDAYKACVAEFADRNRKGCTSENQALGTRQRKLAFPAGTWLMVRRYRVAVEPFAAGTAQA